MNNGLLHFYHFIVRSTFIYLKGKVSTFSDNNFHNLRYSIVFPINISIYVYMYMWVCVRECVRACVHFYIPIKRFAEVKSSLKHFVRDIRTLQSRLVQQSFAKTILREKFNMFANKNFYSWCKFGVDIRNSVVIDQIFN